MAKQETPKIQEVKAFARYIHVSPQKLRLVADMVRRARVDSALEQLKFSAKSAALPISKVINSAIANAVHNFNLNREDLVVKSITVDGGPVMKRLFPRAQGRGEIIRRRMSHINVVLESKPKQKSKKSRSIFSGVALPGSKKDAAKAHDHKHDDKSEDGNVEKIEKKNESVKAAPKSEEKLKKQTSTLKRRLFNRKSGE